MSTKNFNLDLVPPDVLKFVEDNRNMAKGMLIIGPPGSGKTMLAKYHCDIHNVPYFDVDNICDQISSKGLYTDTTHDFLKVNDIWIDDLGDEDPAFNYAKIDDYVKRILKRRYKMFSARGIKTHIVTNLSPSQIKEKYGGRIIDRLFEMCIPYVYNREESLRKIDNINHYMQKIKPKYDKIRQKIEARKKY